MGRVTSATGLARIAVVLSALSLLVSLAGVTPADALHAVARALNADKVGGIRASRTPRPGRLLPLGSNSRFPASVMPSARGPRGPVGPGGPAGPQGAQGPAGVSNIRITNGPSVLLSPTASVSTQVARLDNVPAGSWLLEWVATMDYAGPETIDAACRLVTGSQSIADADASMGTGPGAHNADVLGSVGATTQTQVFSVQLMCNVGPNSMSAIHVDSQRIVAIRADTIDSTG